MTTIIIDSNEEPILINVTEDTLYNNSCTKTNSLTLDLEDYYNKNNAAAVFSSDEDDEDMFLSKPQAPPPSPQQKPMLDFFFSKKLNEELDAFLLVDKEQQQPIHDPLVKHAKILDKLLRKDHHCIYKKKPLKKSPFKHLLKATKNKKQEEVIRKFKEMGL